MLLKWLFTISMLLLCVAPVSAIDVSIIEDISSGNFTADEGYVYSWISVVNVDPRYVSNFTLDSETYTFEVNITYLNSYSSDVSTSFYSKVTGNTSTFHEKWYHILFISDLYFELGSQGRDLQGMVFGGMIVGHLLSDEVVFAPGYFSIVSNHPIDVRFKELRIEDAGSILLPHNLFELIRDVPYIGEHIYQVLSIVGSITSAFVILAYISIKNWTFFLVLFESFVFFHATSIMQNKQGKSSALITESFKAIASDNKLLLDLLVNVFTQIINMFVGAVRMFRG